MVSKMSLEAERSSRSAWNARAAVVRCSGAKVLRTPSLVKASLTGTKVVRSLWAALGVVWVTGVLVGWVAVRRELVWPVLMEVSVVIAVAISCIGFLSSACAVGFPNRSSRTHKRVERSVGRKPV